MEDLRWSKGLASFWKFVTDDDSGERGDESNGRTELQRRRFTTETQTGARMKFLAKATARVRKTPSLRMTPTCFF